MPDRYDDTENAIHHLYDQLSTRPYKAYAVHTNINNFAVSYINHKEKFENSFHEHETEFTLTTIAQIEKK
jgi:hypothetical protein